MPSGQNPWNQIFAGVRRGGGGTLSASRREVWRACRAASVALDEAMRQGDIEGVLRAGYAVVQFNSAYARIVEVHELDVKLRAVQEFIDGKRLQSKATG
jgi:hypothetical protein